MKEITPKREKTFKKARIKELNGSLWDTPF